MHRRGDAWRPKFGVPPVPRMPNVPPMPPIPRVPPMPYAHRSHHGRPFPHGYHGRRRGAWGAVRRVPPPLLIVLGVVGMSVLISGLVMIIGMALMVAAVAVPVLITRGVVRSVRGSRRHHQLAAPPPRGRQLMPPRPAVDAWQQAKSRFAALRTEYAAYECDALAVLRLPALADVTVPSTARFVEAFAEAQALDTDAPLPPPHRDQYVTAVERAWRAWQAAREAAERIRLSHLSEEERATVERVVRLLTTARDTDNDAERLVAYAKARSELAKLERAGHVHIPRPAQAMLDSAYRGQLPA